MRDCYGDAQYGWVIERWDFTGGEQYFDQTRVLWTEPGDITRITVFEDKAAAEETLATWQKDMPEFTYKLVTVRRTTTMQFNYDCEVD